ncbi:V-type ATP synthase subunit I [Streptococcus caviae]|uniref:V-type ATP synthase subunit I n=1 Tax=Streptococcus sp. 'caviae' TaxID=1915004 RepID=UPI00094B8DAD|nr:V-type ATP synthase subunit I [Streptococcus sp. 'caviae']OLN84678.1 V-type ATP synthase subunit I [Streptococcus sp. 'caviae']
MAISQMKKISIVFAKDKLDAVLLTLQRLENLQVREMAQMENWQEVFERSEVHLPAIYQADEDKGKRLEGEEALHYLSQRQQHLETTIDKLRPFIPKESFLTALRKEASSLSFEELENYGRDKGAEQVIAQVNQKMSRLHVLEGQISENEADIASLSKWKDLEITPKELKTFDFVSAAVGTLPKTLDDGPYRQLRENPHVQCQEIFNSEAEYGLLIFFDKKADLHLEEDYHFKPFEYERSVLPAQAIEQMQSDVGEWSKERQRLLEELQHSQKELEDLEAETDYLLNLYSRQEAKKKLASTEHLVALEGWVEKDQAALLQTELTQEFGDSIYLQEVDVEESDLEKVPIKLRNHPLVEPFELVTEMYALPKYYEKDPTPILAPFYFTFFGMMVADLGYGLLLFIATFLLLRYFHLSKGTARFAKFLNILGVSVSLWGLIYGSFFGYTLPVVLISTTTDVMTILALSVAFGFITVVVGLLLGGFQKVRMKKYAEAYHSGFAWCLILIGILLLALGMMLPQLSALTAVGAVLAVVNAAGVVIASVIEAKSLSGIGSGLFNLYNISSYVGDLVSFTRLMALGLSGASIGSAFNLIVGLFPPLGRFTVGLLIFVLLHAINIFLSLLSGYVHGARLIFVEFFGKFYDGGGEAFKPLKPAEKYIKITKTHLEDK